MDYVTISKKYRSRLLVSGAERAGERAHLRSLGLLDGDLDKPFIGVVNSWNEMHPGHVHLRDLAAEVKKGSIGGGSAVRIRDHLHLRRPDPGAPRHALRPAEP